MNNLPTRCLSLAAALLLGVAGVSASAKEKPSVRTLATDIDPNPALHIPASFETDVNKLKHSWYMQNYTVLDKGHNVPDKPATEQDYIDRLQTMNTVIEMPYNNLVRAYIDMYTNRKKDLVEAMLGMSLYYMPIFEQALDREGLPHELKYLPIIESALNPTAVSRAGARGIWQFMAETAKGEGLEVNSVVDERCDPYRASEAAAKFLKKLYNIYHDWSLAIAAYNCGPGNVNKALQRAGGGNQDFWEIYRFLPAETRDYIPAFIAANYVMTNYDKHGISPVLASKPILTDSVHVSRRVHFEQIRDVLDIPIEELRILNPQYLVDVIPGDVHPYPLVLPGLQVYSYIANEDSIVNHNAEKYARRDVVQPVTKGSDTKASNGKGEYVQELVVKYHKVRKGETVAKIAKKYGVSQSSIRKANGLRKKGQPRRNQTLRINTYVTRFVPYKDEQSADSTSVQQPEKQAKAAPETQSNTKTDKPVNTSDKNSVTPYKTPKDQKPVTHTVTKGETLSAIAGKYGVTIEQIRDANNLTNDIIKVGDKLVIPAKASAKKSSGKSARKSTGKKRSSKSSKRKRRRR